MKWMVRALPEKSGPLSLRYEAMKYILGIDQSTQGTKAVLFDEAGQIVGRADYKHKQWIDDRGWVSHDAEEIYQNVIRATRAVLEQTGVDKNAVEAIGVSNQRETSVAWDRSGTAIGKAIVWQCARAKDITDALKPHAELVREKTGLPLSPYFPAGKMAWLVQNEVHEEAFHLGTVDSWLIYRLTEGASFKTDYSNASRTQLFNLHTLEWDKELCSLFGIPLEALPEVCDSNALFGHTDMESLFDRPLPIHSAMGDSHGALFGQGCHHKGMVKTTYGTGSSIMMNIGEGFTASKNGLATSLAWGIDGTVSYVLEGNINYTGAVITWLQDDVGLISSPKEIQAAVEAANPEDTTILVPAFSGLGAPYWDDSAKAMLCGMTRSTGRNEIIKAAEESIAFQINDVVQAMRSDSGVPIQELRVDGGPTKDRYLMQLQSDISNVEVVVRREEELSAMGAAYLAGIAAGVYQREALFDTVEKTCYSPNMAQEKRAEKCESWRNAVRLVTSANNS